MPLDLGMNLGPFEILSRLGAGGMGEVYRARDTRLDREVALKVLPARLVHDEQALGRFQREAKAVAALTHPNIVALHDVGREGDIVYAVIELLEGKTLRDLLAGGPLPSRKVADYGAQIARGLAAAHAKGVIHRDIKPDNLFVTRDGRVKILDFGLARESPIKADETTDPHSPTLIQHTDPGTVMGTVGYMSPEQVRGDSATSRSDIFGLGIVLYEAVTGVRAFDRETKVETMTAIIRDDPPGFDRAKQPVPGGLQRLVRRCLEKQPEQRFQSAHDLAFDLEHVIDASAATTAARPVVPPTAWGWRLGAVFGGLTLFALGLLAGAMFLSGRRTVPAPGPPAEPVKIRPITFTGLDNGPVVDPAGRMMAFTSRRDGGYRGWIMDLATGGEQALTDFGHSPIGFSPDGSSLLSISGIGGSGSLALQTVVGGQVRTIAENVVSADFSPDGTTIAFTRGGPASADESFIGLVEPDGRNERILTAAGTGRVFGVRWSPDGRSLVATATGSTTNNVASHFLLVDVASGALRRVMPPSSSGALLSAAAWSRDSESILYSMSTSLLGSLADPTARFVWHHLDSDTTKTLFWTRDVFVAAMSQGITISRLPDDRIVFPVLQTRNEMRSFALDGSGDPTGEINIRGDSIDRQPSYSPDGSDVIFSSNRGGNLDLWIIDVASGSVRRLTDDPAEDWDPAFTPDGNQIVWSSNRSGHLEIWMANRDGTGARQVSNDGVDAENPTVTADGQWIVYSSGNPKSSGIWRVRPDGSDTTLIHAGSVFLPEVSPNGRWVGFTQPLLGPEPTNIIRFAAVDTGELLSVEIEIPVSQVSGTNLSAGRLRWLPHSESILFVAPGADGKLGIYRQELDPNRDTTATRTTAFEAESTTQTESFGISPDGTTITVANFSIDQTIVLAENVPEPRW